jgi:type VI secretion system secreted protein Hcp
MKTKISLIALVAITCMATHLTAQEISSKSVANDLEKVVRCVISPTETGFSITFENDVKKPMDATATKAAGKKGYDYYQSRSVYSVSSLDNTVTEVISPRDAASGMASGRRQHKPITLSAGVDKSTPVLYKSVSDTKISTEGTVSRSSGGGMGTGKVSMQDMTITRSCGGQTTTIPIIDGVGIIPTADCPDGLGYAKITWTWQDGGVSNEDDWTRTSRSIDFEWKIEEGVCTAMAINEKGLPGEKANKSKSKN